ncbi:MAG TPA: sigma 54-interacting transcriptional regulator [Candidatus Angelobacter sp.]|nr:sigma 54-interacting transcriptional regulator [Candidatus Angelobacter sp.]
MPYPRIGPPLTNMSHDENVPGGVSSADDAELVIRSASLQRVMKLAEKVARHPAAVLIVGETGSGKEMIARTIHNHSLRCNQPLVDVNCAAIPENLVESELFGYEKGAFSGADAMKPGFFEMANKGTLFLDEIGDLDLKIQVKLLRVLDGVPYYRLGGNKKVSVDVRMVAATNQHLEDLVKAGRFRSDLYHRLAQFKLEVPPLRERPEDVVGIAEQVLHQHYPESRFSRDAIDALTGYAWPGNVRELKNVVFGAVLQARDAQSEITAADLRFPDSVSSRRRSMPADSDLDEVEKRAILHALEDSGGNQGKAAEALGISRRTLIRKLKIYREAGLEDSSGSLSLSQQRYYRAQLELPIAIKYAGEQFDAVLLNISAGGAGIRTEKPLKSSAPIALVFMIPGSNSEAPVELPGRVTWANKSGQYGIQFGEISPSLRTSLQRWLRMEMKKDGWDVESRD